MPGEGSRERAVFLTALLYEAISKRKHHLYTEVGNMVETKLARISQLSSENPKMVFTSIGHLIDKEMLEECHKKLDGKKAVGIDGVTKEEYGRNLNANLEKLVERLKKKSYKPKPARRVEIEKENGKTRPLSIYSYEDKLVQEALRRVLEAVFEPHFYEEMMGFRPGRGCHQAIRKLNEMLEWNKTGYVLDADIQSFFNHLDHERIVQFIELKNQRPQHHPAGKTDAESRCDGELQVRSDRRRLRARKRVFTNHSKYLHALCTAVVVQRSDTAEPERVQRNHSICGRFCSVFPI